MKVVAVTQARYNSSRLPGKVLMKIGGKTLLQIHIERILKSEKIDQVILATTFEQQSDQLIAIAKSLNVAFFQGSTENVLDRFYKSVKDHMPDYVVRLTSDCPLVDSEIIDQVVDKCISGGYDYCSNTLIPTFPDGMDVEVMKFSALEEAWNNAIKISDKEHVTPFIWSNSKLKGGVLFKSSNFENADDLSQIRLTVDEPEDFELISELVLTLGDDKPWKAYVDYLTGNPKTQTINSKFKRNEGYMKSILFEKVRLRSITNFSNSNSYRSKIHNLIPGGAHTYSKGDDQFPELSPAAIAYGKGSHVWDIDGNEYLDCSMGLTSVSLGHAYEPVVNKVKEELERGVNFQRPSYLEMEMAEKFLSLVPQHNMVKFAKNGSIVTTAAVKIARAYTGRKLVAFPGDHPFYSYDDWFIGKTECNQGVPEEISNLSVTFKSCNLESLAKLFEKHPNQIACVIMEPEKSACGNGCTCSLSVKDFLQRAIKMAHSNGALLIIDEMITGFKTALPGSMSKYGIDPDMATWGKGIANGFSFCALTGKKEIMELGGIRNKGKEKVFLISTTHGGETHSIAAGLATIDEFLTKDVIAHNQKIGDLLINECSAIIKKHDLGDYVQIIPSNWMPVFAFKDLNKEMNSGMRTLALQEMINRGVLFQGAFAPCFSHTNEDISYFAAAFDETLQVYIKALDSGFGKYLTGEPAKPVFRKYL
jgi:glutamate-1-semialdehyde aminotransferase/spore coat polysaccharide biosynthesis protein SpsF (cytidylyltransferase family)